MHIRSIFLRNSHLGYREIMALECSVGRWVLSSCLSTLEHPSAAQECVIGVGGHSNNNLHKLIDSLRSSLANASRHFVMRAHFQGGRCLRTCALATVETSGAA